MRKIKTRADGKWRYEVRSPGAQCACGMSCPDGECSWDYWFRPEFPKPPIGKGRIELPSSEETTRCSAD